MKRIGVFLLCLTLTQLILQTESHGHGHGHAHDHGHGHGHGHDHDEPPSFKYSRAANELDHGHDHSHSAGESTQEKFAPPHYNEGSDDDDDEEKLAEPFSVISWALGSTVAISLAPIVILMFVRVDNSPKYEPLLKILLSFASGGLLGDAFLHLIPHSIAAYQTGADGHGHSHSHSHSHSHAGGEKHDHSNDLRVGMLILLGIFLFLLAEKFVRHIKGFPFVDRRSVRTSSSDSSRWFTFAFAFAQSRSVKEGRRRAEREEERKEE